MRNALTVSFAGVVLAAALSLVDANSSKHSEATSAKAEAANDIVAAAPVRVPRKADAPAYTGFARIIHVPQRDDVDERASADDRGQSDLSRDDDKPVRLSPPPTRRRDVLSVAPPRAEGPTPIPRFKAKAVEADRSGTPADNIPPAN